MCLTYLGNELYNQNSLFDYKIKNKSIICLINKKNENLLIEKKQKIIKELKIGNEELRREIKQLKKELCKEKELSIELNEEINNLKSIISKKENNFLTNKFEKEKFEVKILVESNKKNLLEKELYEKEKKINQFMNNLNNIIENDSFEKIKQNLISINLFYFTR